MTPIPRFWYWMHFNTSWAESLVQGFSSPDVEMWAEDTDARPQFFAWASHHFDDVTTPEELADRATALKAVFDGAMHLVYGTAHHVVPIVDLECRDGADQPSTWYYGGVPDVRVEPFSAGTLAGRARPRSNPFKGSVEKLIFLARYDATAKALLKYLGVQGLSYVSLYACCDWMKDGGWNEKRIASAAGWSNARYKDFTNTANNPAYLGPFARHGGGSRKPAPTRPMTLGDAIDPIRTATLAFLSERARAIGLTGKWQALVE